MARLRLSLLHTEVNSINLSWSVCSDESIIRYVVQYRQCCKDGLEAAIRTNWMEEEFTGCNIVASHKVSGLLPGTKYELRVLAIYSGGLRSKLSNVILATTQICQTTLPRPQQVVICKDITAGLNTISLRWYPSPEESVTEYLIQYRQYHGSGRHEKPPDGNDNQWLKQWCGVANTNPCTVHELMPNTKYELCVLALSAGGRYSEPSEVICARTQPAREV
jgi:hypothetical protein